MKRIVNPPPGPVKQPTSQEDIDKYLGRKFNLTAFCFDKQLAFIQDPALYKIAVCSRRSGKTIACAADLISTAINNKDVLCLYITLSAKNAKKLVWKELLKINRDYKLGGDVNVSELTITFSNGSQVACSGANTQDEIEKFRGLPIKKCYIDECQSFPAYLKELIDDIIEPALLDHNGSLCLIGTPSPIPTGYFYECAHPKETEAAEDEEHKRTVWSYHHWTFFDNPFVAEKAKTTHEALLQRVLNRRGVDRNDPSIKREYFGLWANDINNLLVRYDSTKNNFVELKPTLKYYYILGIDIGYKDADALAVLAYSDDDPTTYLVEEKITAKQGITELVEQINALDKKYHVTKMVMDMGGLGKKIGEELIKRYNIPVEAAEKTRKMENIELMNDALRTSKLRAKPNSRFAQDSYLVEIDRDKSTPDKIVVSDRYHSDIIDSVLYAFKFSPAYAYVPPKPPPKPGTKEWADKEQDEMWERELEGFLQEQEYQKRMGGEG